MRHYPSMCVKTCWPGELVICRINIEHLATLPNLEACVFIVFYQALFLFFKVMCLLSLSTLMLTFTGQVVFILGLICQFVALCLPSLSFLLGRLWWSLYIVDNTFIRWQSSMFPIIWFVGLSFEVLFIIALMVSCWASFSWRNAIYYS